MSQAQVSRTPPWEPTLSPVPSSLSGRSLEDDGCGDSTEGISHLPPLAGTDSDSINSRSENHGSEDDKNVNQSDDDACASRKDDRKNARTGQDTGGAPQNDPSRLFGMPRYAPFYRGRGGCAYAFFLVLRRLLTLSLPSGRLQGALSRRPIRR